MAVDLENADVMFSWGKDRFYLPHGISVDPQGNLWLTDVALHQAFRYKNNNFEQKQKKKINNFMQKKKL